MYPGSLDGDDDSIRAWIDDHKVPLVPTMDAGLGAEYMSSTFSHSIVMLIADPADASTPELM